MNELEQAEDQGFYWFWRGYQMGFRSKVPEDVARELFEETKIQIVVDERNRLLGGGVENGAQESEQTALESPETPPTKAG